MRERIGEGRGEEETLKGPRGRGGETRVTMLVEPTLMEPGRRDGRVDEI